MSLRPTKARLRSIRNWTAAGWRKGKEGLGSWEAERPSAWRSHVPPQSVGNRGPLRFLPRQIGSSRRGFCRGRSGRVGEVSAAADRVGGVAAAADRVESAGSLPRQIGSSRRGFCRGRSGRVGGVAAAADRVESARFLLRQNRWQVRPARSPRRRTPRRPASQSSLPSVHPPRPNRPWIPTERSQGEAKRSLAATTTRTTSKSPVELGSVGAGRSRERQRPGGFPRQASRIVWGSPTDDARPPP